MSGKHTTRGLIFDIALSSKRQEQEQAQASNVNVRANSRALPKEINRKFGTIWIKCHILAAAIAPDSCELARFYFFYYYIFDFKKDGKKF